MKNILAFIPARIGSQGIKKKNLEKIGELCLYEIPILQAKKSKYINHILLSTDGDEIKKGANKYNINIVDRPEQFKYDNTIQEVDNLMIHSLKEYEKKLDISIDIMVLLYPTGPLRTVDEIDQCIEQVLSGEFDSSLTISEDHSYLWAIDKNSQTTLPTNYKPEERGPRQKESWNQYIENKAVYAFNTKMLVSTGCRIGKKCGYIIMDKMSSIDIDGQEDLELARIIVKNKFKKLDV